jgi:DNA-binding CsgD family transcriptional regulator
MLKREALEFAGAIPLSVVIVDRYARVLEINRAASELLRSGRVFDEQNGVLTAADQTAALHRAIAVVANDTQKCIGMRLPRAGVPPATLLLVGVERANNISSARAVAVVISDPEVKHGPDERALRELFEFTHAEAVVAIHLMRGEGPVAIAASLHTSVNTVRTHVKKLFEKTETCRQGDLVRLLLSSVAQLHTQLSSPTHRVASPKSDPTSYEK